MFGVKSVTKPYGGTVKHSICIYSSVRIFRSHKCDQPPPCHGSTLKLYVYLSGSRTVPEQQAERAIRRPRIQR